MDQLFSASFCWLAKLLFRNKKERFTAQQKLQPQTGEESNSHCVNAVKLRFSQHLKQIHFHPFEDQLKGTGSGEQMQRAIHRIEDNHTHTHTHTAPSLTWCWVEHQCFPFQVIRCIKESVKEGENVLREPFCWQFSHSATNSLLGGGKPFVAVRVPLRLGLN